MLPSTGWYCWWNAKSVPIVPPLKGDRAVRQFKPNWAPFATGALPASSATTSSAAARASAASEPARAAAAGRERDRARDACVHRLEAASQQCSLERLVSDVPGAALARIDAFERLRPKGDAAEHNRVRKERGEDVRLRRELLPVLLGPGHVEPKPQRVLHEVAAGGGSLRHEPPAHRHHDACDHHGHSDQAPTQRLAEHEGRRAADEDEGEPEAAPGDLGLMRVVHEEAPGRCVVIDLAL